MICPVMSLYEKVSCVGLRSGSVKVTTEISDPSSELISVRRVCSPETMYGSSKV